MYNEIIATLIPVEKPLMQKRISTIDKYLQPGMDELRWNSQGIDKFIKDAMEIVTEVKELVEKMKKNVATMKELMEGWQKPLYERKAKPNPPDDVENLHTAAVSSRFEDIRQNGKDIAKHMKDTVDAIKPDKKSPIWLAYVDYVNGLVIEGITNGINSSMLYLAEQISISYNKQNGLAPIFDIKVCLDGDKVQFEPSITCNASETGIRDIINKIVNHFISLSIQMPSRLDIQGGDYLVEIKDQFELYGSTQLISRNMNEIENASANFLDQYSDIAFLWEETLDDYFQKFLQSGPDLREEFIKKLRAEAGDDIEEEQLEVEIEAFDAMNAKILDGVATQHPSLDEFDEKIVFLTEVKHRINSLPADSNIGWIKVDSKPLIKELQGIINQWIERFSSFLLVNTVRRIENMEKFINGVEAGIKDIPEKADTEQEKKLLTVVMTCLRDVGQIGKKTIELVNPMKETIILLKKHAVEMKADYLVELENCKTDLLDVADRALGPTKEAILPLQGKEANNVKDKRRAFQLKVIDFRREFTSALPYNKTDSSPEIIQDAYDKIQEYYQKTMDMENEAKDLQVLESLFDL